MVFVLCNSKKADASAYLMLILFSVILAFILLNYLGGNIEKSVELASQSDLNEKLIQEEMNLIIEKEYFDSSLKFNYQEVLEIEIEERFAAKRIDFWDKFISLFKDLERGKCIISENGIKYSYDLTKKEDCEINLNKDELIKNLLLEFNRAILKLEKIGVNYNNQNEYFLNYVNKENMYIFEIHKNVKYKTEKFEYERKAFSYKYEFYLDEIIDLMKNLERNQRKIMIENHNKKPIEIVEILQTKLSTNNFILDIKPLNDDFFIVNIYDKNYYLKIFETGIKYK